MIDEIGAMVCYYLSFKATESRRIISSSNVQIDSSTRCKFIFSDYCVICTLRSLVNNWSLT